jgi:hypothetical protein
VRAAHADDRFHIVGAKVYSAHKDGKDVGELVGIGPIGVRATLSKAEILAMDADCVIVTPQPSAILEGLDNDVIALLESGKNVVTTAAYHNVAMPNWHNVARTPTARMRAISNTNGAARTTAERVGLAGIRALTSVPVFDRFTDRVLRGLAETTAPARATPARLLQACRTGNSSLHGTGVHPTYQVERMLMRMTRALSKVTHVRFIESLDFSLAPEGMWGGLEFFGFGRDPADINSDWILAKAGDFYYGDLTGNVAHALFGTEPRDVRVVRSLRGIPAVRDIQVHSTSIKAGTTAVMHMTHRGYIGDHHFFTNEECWFLGGENAYHGDNLPFGRLPPLGGYTFEITGEPACIRGQSSSAVLRPNANHPINTMSVRAVLDAVGPVCASTPGIVIDDSRPHYRHDARFGSTAGQTK